MTFRILDYQRDKRLIHDILYGCGSKVSKQSYSYIGVLLYHSPEKCFGEFLDNDGFYFVSRAAKHWRPKRLRWTGESTGEGSARPFSPVSWP